MALSNLKYSLNNENILPLVEKAQLGDSKALSQIIANISPFVHVLARRFLTSGVDIDDLYQEGMLGVLSAVKSYDSKKSASFKTYATLCVQNRLLSVLKKRSENSVFDSHTISIENTTEEYFSNDSVEDITIGKESFDRIVDFIDSKLSNKEQEVLKLFLSGYSYDEIAKKTNASVKSVDSSLQRVRQKLRQFKTD